ncbi:multinuclear nonheme iron-dependent oxidase [Shewanella surugensis]|uniref:multinuclear nonheme iron-dependent oxidase n=1 Tax=Shewanella surugensis TaxID=212020 RepID=UPI00289D24A2|nr:DUF692 family multinuclear iron-containing protein [Shewanella surugensis]
MWLKPLNRPRPNVRGEHNGRRIGLRFPHVQTILAEGATDIPWFEVLADNWLAEGGLNKKMLLAISERYPFVFHSVGLLLDGLAALDWHYLEKSKH